MYYYNIICIMVIMTYIFRHVQTFKDKEVTICADEKSVVVNNKDIETVEWPASNISSYLISKPLCLDSRKQLLRRNCTVDGWYPKRMKCEFAQYSYQDSNKCPKYYTHIETPFEHPLLCIRIIKPGEWNNTCLTSGSSKSLIDFDENIFKLILNKLESSSIEEIWTPMRKWGKYEPVVLTLPGPKWGTSPNLVIKGDDDNNLCVSCKLGIKLLEMTDCKKPLHDVCFLNEPSVVEVIYPENYFTSRYADRQNKVFSVEKISKMTWDEASKLSHCQTPQIESAEHNYIYESIMYESQNNMCWMGLSRKLSGLIEPELDQLEWTTGNKEITFVNWHEYTNFSGIHGLFLVHSHLYSEIQSNWDLVGKYTQYECILCERAAILPEAQISLEFRPSLQRLELTVYSPEGLWRHHVNHSGVNCFTDAGIFLTNSVELNLTLSKIVNTIIINEDTYTVKRIYELLIFTEVAGRYWCEAHRMQTFNLISTNQVYAYKILPLTTYAMLVDLQVKDEQSHQIVADEPAIIKALNDAFKEYSANMTNIRLMQIINIINSNVRVLAHFDINVNSLEIENDMFDIVLDIHKQTRQLIAEINDTKNIVNSFNHTTYCIPSNTSSFTWNSIAKLDEAIVPLKICLQENGLPIFMKCIGDTKFGGVLTTKLKCETDMYISEITEELYNNSNTRDYRQYAEILKNLPTLIKEYEAFKAVDIHSIGKIMNNAANYKSTSITIDNQFNLNNLTSIINMVLTTPYNVTTLAQRHLNATNLILDAADLLLTEIVNYENNVNEELSCTETNVGIYVFRPYLTNNTGIVVTKEVLTGVEGTSEFIINVLNSEPNISELVSIENFEAAIWVSRNVLDTLTQINSNFDRSKMGVVFKAIYKNGLFSPDEPEHLTSNVPQLSVFIPGYDSNLEEAITIIFKKESDDSLSKCAYWKFYQPGEGRYGNWSHIGCKQTNLIKNGTFLLCQCSHMTSYSQIMEIFPPEISEYHKRILNIITLTGCTLSLSGISLILLTAVLFKSFRQKAGTKVLIQLSIAISLQLFVMIFLNIIPLDLDKIQHFRETILCVVVGSILQYSLLSSFAWMVVIAVLQYRRYVTVLGAMRPSHFILKSTIFGWVFPLLVVIITLAVNFRTYIPKTTNNNICYPSDFGLYFGVLVPIIVMILLNLVIFLIICYNVLKLKHIIKNKSKDPDLIYAQLRLSFFLFFLLGLTWLFGVVQMFTPSLVFRYLFSITSTMQGFILFIYFILLDRSTRKLWKDSIDKIFV